MSNFVAMPHPDTVRVGRAMYADGVVHGFADHGVDPSAQPFLVLPLCAADTRFVREVLPTDPPSCATCEDLIEERLRRS